MKHAIRAVALAGCLLASCAGTLPVDADGWTHLFDGESLAGWKRTDFGGQGDVVVTNGALVLKPGKPFTGVTFVGSGLPTSDYEIELRGAKLDGEDFFCCLTVPVGESHCSLVLGGWGGRLVGLSSLDDMDASENGTARFLEFETGRYYAVRMHVTTARITAWLDGEKVVDQDLRDHAVSVRWEVEPSRPLGIASYETEAAFTRVRYRTLH